MFHCNGWCFPWSMSVVGGTHVCLRWVRAKAIWDALAEHSVTHLCGAPIVMSTILNAPAEEKRPLRIRSSSSPPPRRRPKRCWPRWPRPGFNVTHLYGLTETYGPAVVNDWNGRLGQLDAAGARRQEGAPGRALCRARGI